MSVFSSTGLLLFSAALLFLAVAASLIDRRLRQRRQRQQSEALARFADAFVIKPYLQLGDQARAGSSESLEIYFHTTPDSKTRWSVQVRVDGEKNWRAPLPAVGSPFRVEGVGAHLRFVARLSGLPAGKRFQYRLLADDTVAFVASATSRGASAQPYSFVVCGDLGEPEDKSELRIAHQIQAVRPDFVFIPGDIAYSRGRVCEYLPKFFPVYNADASSPDSGAPLLRSTLIMAAAGNHDMGMPHAADQRDLDAFPDLLGYFRFWSLPLNGPLCTNGAVNTPALQGDGQRQQQFLDDAGVRYPRMVNYSFDWGNSHWVVIDSNAYVDWTDKTLLAWLEADLAAAGDATWRFVSFHHPPFSSNVSHANEQRMRLLAPLLERYGVDVVFTGHNHCYERTKPLRFQPAVSKADLHTENCPVPGQLQVDGRYDGMNCQRPDGIIYVTDGAGGASLHRWVGAFKTQPFSAHFNQETHSFTVCAVNGRSLVARQISEHGEELDRWSIEK